MLTVRDDVTSGSRLFHILAAMMGKGWSLVVDWYRSLAVVPFRL